LEFRKYRLQVVPVRSNSARALGVSTSVAEVCGLAARHRGQRVDVEITVIVGSNCSMCSLDRYVNSCKSPAAVCSNMARYLAGLLAPGKRTEQQSN